MLKNTIIFILLIFTNLNNIFTFEHNKDIIKTDNTPITVGISERLPSLHPFDNNIEHPFILLNNIFEGLVSLAPDGEITRGLAERYRYLKDDNVVYFYIDPNTKWSNGEPIKADHFVNRFKTLCRYLVSDEFVTKSPIKHYTKKEQVFSQLKILSCTFLPIKNLMCILSSQKDIDSLGVIAESDYVLRFDLKNTSSFDLKKFLLILSNPIFSPLLIDINEEIDYYRSDIRRYNTIPTAGPYKLTTNNHNDSEILLIPNSYYNPKFKAKNKILFKYFDSDDLKNALIRDEIDVFYHTINKMIDDKKASKYITCLKTNKLVKASVIFDDINRIKELKKYNTILDKKLKKTYCDLSDPAKEFKFQVNKQNVLFTLHLNTEDDEFLTNRIDMKIGSRLPAYDHLITENFYDKDLFIPLSYLRKAFTFKRSNVDEVIDHFLIQDLHNKIINKKEDKVNNTLGIYGSTKLLHDAFVEFFKKRYRENKTELNKNLFVYSYTGNIEPFIEYQEYASFNNQKIYFNANNVNIFPTSLKFLTKKIKYNKLDDFRNKYDKCINIGTSKHQAGLPFDSRNLEETLIIEQIFEGLFKYDYKEGKIVPAVAKSWWHSKDYKHWKFKIRDDAYWSDGSEVTAKNFIDSWKQLLVRGYVKTTTTPVYESVPDIKDSNDLFIKLFPIKNAEGIIKKTKSMDSLGVRAIENKTIELFMEFPLTESTMLLLLSQVELSPIYDDYNGEITPRLSNGRYKIENIYQYNSSIVTELGLNEYYKPISPNYNNPHKKVRILCTFDANILFTFFNEGIIDIIYSPSQKEISEHYYSVSEEKIIDIPTNYYYTINVVDDLQKDSRLIKSLIKTLQTERNFKNLLIGKPKTYKLQESELEYKEIGFYGSVKELKKLSKAFGYDDKCPVQLRIDGYIESKLNKITHFTTSDFLLTKASLAECYHGPDMISLNLSVIPITSFEQALQHTYSIKQLVNNMDSKELSLFTKNIEIANNKELDKITRGRAKAKVLKMVEDSGISFVSIAFLQRKVPIIHKKYLNLTPNVHLNNPRGLLPIEFWEMDKKVND